MRHQSGSSYTEPYGSVDNTGVGAHARESSACAAGGAHGGRRGGRSGESVGGGAGAAGVRAGAAGGSAFCEIYRRWENRLSSNACGFDAPHSWGRLWNASAHTLFPEQRAPQYRKRPLVSRHEHPAMSFQILDSISSRWRPILWFRQDNRSRGLGPSVVLVDVVNIDEHTINDPWQSGP